MPDEGSPPARAEMPLDFAGALCQPRNAERSRIAEAASNLPVKLASEEASSVFTPSGELQPEIVARSTLIISGTNLGNKALVEALTANGSDIADWGKYTTPTFRSPAGAFQVHFYYNSVIDEVFYGMDYKIKFVGGAP